MPVVYEPRSFLHDGGYPAMTETDHVNGGDPTPAFGDPDVSGLATYNPPASLLADDRRMLGDSDEVVDELSVNDGQIDTLAASSLSSLPTLPNIHPQIRHQTTEQETGVKEPSDGETPASLRGKIIPRPDRTVSKNVDGKFYCNWPSCKEATQGFSRKCEWNKHMDKHERPYRCEHRGCEKLAGFTYSGGLLRHEREVHGKHGGPKKPVMCPHTNCKRHTGKGFSRQENLNEHLRRVHTEGIASPEEQPPSDNDSDKTGGKRKRSGRDSSVEDFHELREEMKRLRQENLELRDQNDQLHDQVQLQQQQSIAMMGQIAELQDAVRLSNANRAAPTAAMI